MNDFYTNLLATDALNDLEVTTSWVFKSFFFGRPSSISKGAKPSFLSYYCPNYAFRLEPRLTPHLPDQRRRRPRSQPWRLGPPAVFFAAWEDQLPMRPTQALEMAALESRVGVEAPF